MEPHHFHGQDAAKNYGSEMMKQLNWRFDCWVRAQDTPKEKQELEKLGIWIRKHPEFMKIIKKKLKDDRPDIVELIELLEEQE